MDQGMVMKSYILHLPEKSLETKRLLLRPMLETDLDALHLIFTDPKVMASFGAGLFNRDQMQRWLQRNLAHQAQFGYGLFAVLLKTDGTLIGDCGLEQMEVGGRSIAELGYDVRSDYWSQGFATEAALAVRDYAFEVLQLPQLISLIRVGNLASKRVAEKVGMQLVEELTRYDSPYWKYGMKNKNAKFLP